MGAVGDTMIKDGLWDAFNGYHMGTTAENVMSFQISRAVRMRRRVATEAAAAGSIGKFRTIVPVTVR